MQILGGIGETFLVGKKKVEWGAHCLNLASVFMVNSYKKATRNLRQHLKKQSKAPQRGRRNDGFYLYMSMGVLFCFDFFFEEEKEITSIYK